MASIQSTSILIAIMHSSTTRIMYVLTITNIMLLILWWDIPMRGAVAIKDMHAEDVPTYALLACALAGVPVAIYSSTKLELMLSINHRTGTLEVCGIPY